jgi:hypothetical protein
MSPATPAENGTEVSEPPVQIEVAPDEVPSIILVEAIAQLEGVDALQLDAPLSAAIDPDTIDMFVQYSPNGGVLAFEYAGYDVVISASGQLSVSSAASRR